MGKIRIRFTKIKIKDCLKINLINYLFFLLANFLLKFEYILSTKNILKLKEKSRYCEKVSTNFDLNFSFV
jgi:hypothetical protein